LPSTSERTEVPDFSGKIQDFFPNLHRFLLYAKNALGFSPKKTPLKNAAFVLSEMKGTGQQIFQKISAEKICFCPFRDRGTRKPLGNRGAENAGKHRDNQRHAA